MRFSNSSLQKRMPLVYFFLFIGTLLSILVYGVMKEGDSDALLWYVLPVAFFLFAFLFVYRTVVYFEYDSDGLVLNFINKGLVLSNFLNYREKRAEFPKEKLKGFKIKDFILYRSLYIFVVSHSGRIKRLKFNITFLSKRKRRILQQSLEKVVQNNRQIDGRRA